MEHLILEACVDSVESALAAAQEGASKLELYDVIAVKAYQVITGNGNTYDFI